MQTVTPNQSIAGFTLIEMLVSLALYTIVVTIAVGSLLVLVDSNRRVQGDQSVMTTLTFAMDSMTREIRTGRSYFCSSRSNTSSGGPANIFNSSNNPDAILGTSTYANCSEGNDGNLNFHGISFVEGGDSVTGGDIRIMYYMERSGSNVRLMRRVGDSPAESIVSEGIVLSRVDFIVTGARPLSAGLTDGQPTVTIIIEATETGGSTDKPFILQTTVTQRELDL
jgi:prepilin-type N-terminal cleavage/methylation domain-containing protein